VIVRGALVIVALLALVYVGDDLWVQYRMARASALDTVTVYYATKLKNGQLEIYYHQPVTEVCVRAMFPHLGHNPCWYVRRQTVKVIASN
jgi:hypothetical protein